jgi:hypothetical protein
VLAALLPTLLIATGALAAGKKHARAELRIGHSDVLLASGRLTGTVALRDSGAAARASKLAISLRLRARPTRRRLQTLNVPAIGPGKRVVVKVNVALGQHGAGVYVVEACADSGHRVVEANESDNCKHVALITVPLVGAPQQLQDSDNDGVENDADADPNDPGNTGPDDDTPPETVIDMAPTGTVADTPATVTFHASEVDTNFECRTDGGLWAGCASPYTVGPLGGGAHVLEVRARDVAGNSDPTPAHAAWTTLDQTAPETVIDTGPANSANDHTASFTFHSSDPGSTFQCRLNVRVWAPCASPDSNVPGVSEGPNLFEVRATDPSGNQDQSPAQYRWTVGG